MLSVNLRLAGILILALAAVYPTYSRRFGWREELQRVSLLTRNIFQVHCGFIVLLLVLQGMLLAMFPQAVLERNAAAIALLIGLCAFWVYRLIAQLAIFDRRLWIGHRFNSFVHVMFTVFWMYLSAVCGWALWNQWMV